MKLFGILFIVNLIAFSAIASENITVVGLDKDGKLVQTEIPSEKFMEKFGSATLTVHEQTLKSLESTAQPQGKLGPWSLRTVSIGLALGFEFGLGPILKMSTTPRLRLVYSNSSDGPMP